MSRCTFFLIAMAFLRAEDLCGPQDAQVCMSSSMGFQLNFQTEGPPAGTTIVLSLPGLEFLSTPGVTGTASAAYRFGGQGTLVCTSHSNVVFDPLVLLATDATGTTAVCFTLPQSVAAPGSYQFLVQNLEVCQRVGDGPTSVTIPFAVYIPSGKTLKLSKDQRKLNDWFTACTAFSGNLPYFSASQRLFFQNPYDEAVTYQIGGTSGVILPHARMELPSSLAGGSFRFESPRELPFLIYEEDEDIAVEAIATANHSDYLIPHIARDTASWSNVFKLATGELLSLRWTRGEEVGGRLIQSGLFELEPNQVTQPGTAWMRLHGTVPFQGFYNFSRTQSPGSAFVNAARLEPDNRSGWNRLYLPHVAADRAQFWTGYSIANAGAEAANLEWRAFSSTGVLHSEQSVLAAGGNEIGIIFTDRFAGAADVSWIEILSDQPIAGLELQGGMLGSSTHFAGILLPHMRGTKHQFPFLLVDATHWSGLALVNPGSESQNVTLTYRNAEGGLISTDSFIMTGLQKRVFLVPPGAEQAEANAPGCIGYAVIGVGNGKIGAYEARLLE